MAWLESESLITTELLDGLELGRGTRVHRDPSLTFRGRGFRGLRTHGRLVAHGEIGLSYFRVLGREVPPAISTHKEPTLDLKIH